MAEVAWSLPTRKLVKQEKIAFYNGRFVRPLRGTSNVQWGSCSVRSVQDWALNVGR